MRTLFLCALTIVLAIATAQAGQPMAGIVKSLEGDVFVQRGDEKFQATIGDKLFVSDTITTEKASCAGIMLEDDALISLGSNSKLELSDFAFAPQKENFAIVIKFLKGSFTYMSGIIGRLAPDKIRIETPDAIIAVHGTRFLAHVEEEQ
ncbi:MAG: FecR domain-containing protein [Desulfomicrobium apsheronum]|nr:FecR domain-containing protein [Desulfomicrobium apsheronum]